MLDRKLEPKCATDRDAKKAAVMVRTASGWMVHVSNKTRSIQLRREGGWRGAQPVITTLTTLLAMATVMMWSVTRCPHDVARLKREMGEGAVVVGPPGADDDDFMITYAQDLMSEARQSCQVGIVTNDLFRDDGPRRG